MAGEDNETAIGAPGRIALHVGRVVGARQAEEHLPLPVVDGQDALQWKKELRERQVRLGHEDRLVLDGADHIVAVGRDLREQAERLFVVLAAVIVPGDDVAFGQRHLRGDPRDHVGCLVVGVVHVHGQGRRILAEGMAIAADRQVLEHDRRRLG